MNRVQVRKTSRFRGECVPPPDKSISHRSVFFCSIAEGKSRVRNFLAAHDPLSTVAAFRALGVDIQSEGTDLIISSGGLQSLREAHDIIDCGNSGTTARLLIGLLSGNPFFSVLTGDKSIRQRPMARVIFPCIEMGALILARDNNRYPPVSILGRRLKPLKYSLPVASAQVKSSLILASLYAEGTSEITEPSLSRDHTERMLPAFGASLSKEGNTVTIQGYPSLAACDVEIPGDFSSAAFFITAALLIRDAEIIIRNCGINPTRTGFLEVIRNMGGNLTIENEREISGEPIADIVCSFSPDLKGVTISGDSVPLLIDEFPILSLLATQAEGTTEIRDAGELRVKESDRISAMSANLSALGARIEERPDGMIIQGRTPLTGTTVTSYGDHRIAMTMAIAGLIAEGETDINGAESIDISFPGFFDLLRTLCT